MSSHEDEIAKFAAWSMRLRKHWNLQRLCKLYDACNKFTAKVMVHQKSGYISVKFDVLWELKLMSVPRVCALLRHKLI